MTMVGEFKKFILRGNVIDLAVGVVIGAAFNTVVNSLVNNILTPPLSLLTGGINFSSLAVSLPGTSATIQYGLFIQALIGFIIVGFVLFLIVRMTNKLFHEEKPNAPVSKSPELLVLEEIRDELKK